VTHDFTTEPIQQEMTRRPTSKRRRFNVETIKSILIQHHFDVNRRIISCWENGHADYYFYNLPECFPIFLVTITNDHFFSSDTKHTKTKRNFFSFGTRKRNENNNLNISVVFSATMRQKMQAGQDISSFLPHSPARKPTRLMTTTMMMTFLKCDFDIFMFASRYLRS